MNRFSENQKIIGGLIFLAILSLIISKVGKVGYAWGALVFLAGIYLTVKNKNRNGEGHLFAAYIMAGEVFFRMTWSGLPWEFGKYAMVILLILGMVFDRRKRDLPLLMIVYFMVMLVSIPLTIAYYYDPVVVRKTIIFNMFGPFSLMIATLYFYQLKITMEEFKKLSRWIGYGVFSMSILVLFNVGDYASVDYGFSSNSDSSGGFSGNQISTAFGLGVTVLGLNLVLKNRLFAYIWIDAGLFVLFIFQGLMTFSRGGMMGGMMALFAGALFFYFANIGRLIMFFKKNIYKLMLAVLVGIGAFMYANEITGGNLYARYFNVREDGSQLKEDYSTGRGDIVGGDIQLFFSSDFIGVGPGVSRKERPTHKNFAAHVEYSRMLAEHGVLGLVSLIIMFLIPLRQFFMLLNRPENQMIFVSFMVLSMLTMTHAAMRLGMVGFFYGMAFLIIVKQVKSKEKTK